jgi:hypothetical protein
MKTFDGFVMILCALDLSMPVAEIQAEKMGVHSCFYSLFALIILVKKENINSHDVLMLLRDELAGMYINHYEYPFPKQMFHPATIKYYFLNL